MLLEARNVTKHYQGVHALEDVSIQLTEGECLGLVGPNGAGKSTLLHVLSGFTPPTHGHVLLRGEDVTRKKPHSRVHLGLGRTFQIVEPIMGMTCLESVMVASHARQRTTRAAAKAAERCLSFVGLDDFSNAKVDSMSLARQRLLEFARVLALEPAAILLDEPMSGLTLVERRRVAESVKDLHDRGVGIILVEHDMPIIADLCDRVVVLDQGRHLASGTPDEVARHELVKEAYLGTGGDGPTEKGTA
jgi:branched-chain amino acid transport system ATP-binding protein